MGFILLVGGQKGGTGKSATAVNLAVRAKQLDIDVVIIDADPQGSATDWADIRNSRNDVAPIPCECRQGRSLAKELVDRKNRYELVIVDCDGRSSDSQIAAMTVADMVMIVLQPSSADIWTLETMRKIKTTVESAIGRDVPCSILFNRASTNANDPDVWSAKELVEEKFPEFSVLSRTIRDRKPVRTAFGQGLGLLEVDLKERSSADVGAIEYRALFKELFQK